MTAMTEHKRKTDARKKSDHERREKGAKATKPGARRATQKPTDRALKNKLLHREDETNQDSDHESDATATEAATATSEEDPAMEDHRDFADKIAVGDTDLFASDGGHSQ